MNWQSLWNDNKELILVVAAGLFSIVAAVLKSKMKLSPTLGWLVASVVCLAGGGVLWHLEYNKYPFDPEKSLSLENTGALLLIGAALLGATGAIWTVINLMRTLFGGSPKDDERPRGGNVWRARFTVAAWVLVVLSTIGAFKGLEYNRRKASLERAPIEEYEKRWKLALA